jgi:murein DD-endopeptidase MepM/ murein hydrolase activator NlpD
MPRHFSLKSLILLLTLLAVAFIFTGCSVVPEGSGSSAQAEQTPQLPQPKTLTDATEIELLNAIQTASQGREDVLAFIIFRVTIDHVQYNADKSLAAVYITLVDKQTGLVQSSEPGLVIAHRNTDPAAASRWRVIFPADTNYAEELNSLPDSMISADAREHYMPAAQQQAKAGVTYSGYLLPWTGGEMHYLTGSIGHVYTYKSCPSTCLYAFDFANGTMFPIRAAKAGTVKYAEWSYPNGNTTNANYIVLEDTTTTPTTYQVYFHLAQGSIPAPLRTIGAKVVQGQFIGNADDTGYSTGNHLHFHVHTNPTSYWGTSVDITFDDVKVNGGRPRMCSEASAYPQLGSECEPGNKYVSGNLDKAIPTGAITDPLPGSVVTSTRLNVSGWMQDDFALKQGQLLIALADGVWKPVGDILTVTPFTSQLDLCAIGVPDGDFSLELQVTDKAGNTSAADTGLTHLKKQASCGAIPPVCKPAENQAAIFSDFNFQGACQVLDIGDYPDLDKLTVKVGQVKSIVVNSAVSAVLYPERNFTGQAELLQNSAASLPDSTTVGANLASLKIANRINPPAPPELTLPSRLTEDDALTFTWVQSDGAETSSQITGPHGFTAALDWQTGTSWNVGLLAAGDYQWTVTSRNLAGTASASQNFSVAPSTIPPVTEMQPLPEVSQTNAIPLQWQVTSGVDKVDHFELQYRVNGAEWTLVGPNPAGTARSLTFTGEPGKTYEFRIRALGVNGVDESFPDSAQAMTQVADAKVCQPDIYEGAAGDNSFASASPIVIGDTQEHTWCPAGDIDWVVFAAKAGDKLQMTTEPVNPGAAASITLYDVDGSTVLGSTQPADENSGASLDWIVPADGTYAFSMAPVNPAVMGTDAKYKASLQTKGTIEVTPLICGGTAIPAALGGLYVASKQMKKKRNDALGR